MVQPKRRASRCLLALACLLGWGCRHTLFQYAPSGREREGYDRALMRFAQQVELDPAALEPEFDLEGRRSLIQLVTHVALTRPKLDTETRAVLLGSAVAAGLPLVAIDDPSSLNLATLQRILAELREQILPSEDPALAKELAGRLSAELAAQRPRQCSPADFRVSYRARILQHLDGPKTPTYETWRDSTDSLHLVSLRCEERYGLLLMTWRRDESSPRYALWQFLTPEQWAWVKPRLEKAFE
jgi:hypothetical protein